MYREDPDCPGYWFYGDLRIQADVETHQFVVDFARRQLAPGTRILDLATGEGALVQQLADAGFKPAGTSWNDRCRGPGPLHRVDLDGPFGVTDVGGSAFPLICAIEIIEHLERPAAFLRHSAALLEPGGTLLLSTPNVESAAARLQWLVRGRPAMFSGEEVTRNRHIYLPWREGIEHLIAAAGLDIRERHLLGAFRFGAGSLLTPLKRAAYAAMTSLLPGDLRGTSRLYVLSRSESARPHGPAEVY